MDSNFFDSWAMKIQKFANEHKLFIMILTVLLFFYRRPGQFLYPYIWDEDGLDILPQYLESGLMSLFFPEKGYIILVSRIINIIAIKISFFYYPQIAFLLTLAFQLYIIYAIIYSPTNLKYKLFCGFSVLLLKTDPECFLIPLYNFWWAGILLILVTLWNDCDSNESLKNNSFFVRVVYIFIGGFSSPLIVFATPLLYFKYVIKKTRINLYLFIISLLPFISQFTVMLYLMIKNNSFSKSSSASISTLYIAIKHFISNAIFIATNNLSIFLIFIFYLIVLYLLLKKNKNCSFYEWINNKLTIIILISWQIGSIIASSVRLDISIAMAPRYLFYPYIIMNFIILNAIHDMDKKLIKLLLIISLSFPLFDNSIYTMSRDHRRFNDWQQQIAHVLRTGNNLYFRNNYDGYYELLYFKLNYSQCKYLIKNSLIFNNIYINIKNENPQYDLDKFMQLYQDTDRNNIQIYIDRFFKNYYDISQVKSIDWNDNNIDLYVDRPFQNFLIMGHIVYENEQLYDIILTINDKKYLAQIDNNIFYSLEKKEKYKNFIFEFNQEDIIPGKYSCSIIVLTENSHSYKYDFTLNVKDNFSNKFQDAMRKLPKNTIKKTCIGSIDKTENDDNQQHISGWVVHSVSPPQSTDSTYLLAFTKDAGGTAFPAFTVPRMDVAVQYKTWHFKDTGFYASVPSGQEYWIGYEWGGKFHQCTNLHISADTPPVRQQ